MSCVSPVRIATWTGWDGTSADSSRAARRRARSSRDRRARRRRGEARRRRRADRRRDSRRAQARRDRRSRRPSAPSRGSHRAARSPGEEAELLLRPAAPGHIATIAAAETISSWASRTGAALISRVRGQRPGAGTPAARRSSPRPCRPHARAASRPCWPGGDPSQAAPVRPRHVRARRSAGRHGGPASVITTPSGSCAITACSCARESCARPWRSTRSTARETRRASSDTSSKSSSPSRPASAEVTASAPSRLAPVSSGTTISERDSI